MEDAERATRQTGHRGEPEELCRREVVADLLQADDEGADDEPDGERHRQVGGRDRSAFHAIDLPFVSQKASSSGSQCSSQPRRASRSRSLCRGCDEIGSRGGGGIEGACAAALVGDASSRRRRAARRADEPGDGGRGRSLGPARLRGAPTRRAAAGRATEPAHGTHEAPDDADVTRESCDVLETDACRPIITPTTMTSTVNGHELDPRPSQT